MICRVKPEWVDHYGHMNLAYYLVVFDLATDLLWPSLNLGEVEDHQVVGKDHVPVVVHPFGLHATDHRPLCSQRARRSALSY